MIRPELTYEEICDIQASLEFMDKIRKGEIKLQNPPKLEWVLVAAECLPRTLEHFNKLMKRVPSFDY